MIGETLGSYRVSAKIGEGGMGAVYLAEHPLIGRKVAIKMLRPEYSDHEEAVNRFFREARLTAGLRHPALVDVFDYGVHTSGSAYIIMEYLEGESLEDRLHKGKLSTHTAVEIARQIAVGMGVAHGAGIIHRDLKPGNVFLTPDPSRRDAEIVKILDFGIAKLTNREGPPSQATRTDIVMGTPLYMAPEQCRGAGNVDLRADIYSLGCIFYEMLCLRPPFVYSWSGELIAAHLHEIPPPPRTIDPSIHEGVEAIVLKMLAKSLKQRHQTMEEAIFEIESFIATDPSWPAAGAMGLGTHRSGGPPARTPFPPHTPFPAGRSAGVEASSDLDPTRATTGQRGPSARPLDGTMMAPADPFGAGRAEAAALEGPKDVSASTLGRGVALPRSPSVRPSGRAPLGVWVFALAVAAAMAAGVFFFVRRARESWTSTTASSASAVAAESTRASATALAKAEDTAREPTVAEVRPQQPEPPAPPQLESDPSSAPGGASIPSDDTAKTPPGGVGSNAGPAADSDTIRVAIVNGRSGLTVRVDGRVAPLPLRLPRDMQLHDLSFATPNFRPESRRIRADRDQAIRLDNKPRFFEP